jgi:ribosomal protein S18 acetylase RimI-like enzyme
LGVDVAAADESDLADLADVAARTFPLACPPGASPENIGAFVAEQLSQSRFREYLADPDRAVFVARDGARILGYAMLIRGVPDDADVERAVAARPAVEVSKIYVLPESHGTGAGSALMTAALRWARDAGARSVWLGVNQQNRRAQRFYAKHGFVVTGTKTFRLGAGIENDFVLVRAL